MSARDWQIFGHSSDFPTWSEGQIVRQKCQIFGETLNPHISGLERAFDQIPKSKIIYWEVAIGLHAYHLDLLLQFPRLFGFLEVIYTSIYTISSFGLLMELGGLQSLRYLMFASSKYWIYTQKAA